MSLKVISPSIPLVVLPAGENEMQFIGVGLQAILDIRRSQPSTYLLCSKCWEWKQNYNYTKGHFKHQLMTVQMASRGNQYQQKHVSGYIPVYRWLQCVPVQDIINEGLCIVRN